MLIVCVSVDMQYPDSVCLGRYASSLFYLIIEGNPNKRVRVQDLIQIPTKAKTTSTRRSTRKVPSWHLTSQEALKFIKDSHDRTQEKERKEQKKAKITKEALKRLVLQRKLETNKCLGLASQPK